MKTFLAVVGAVALLVMGAKCASSCVTLDKGHGAATLKVPEGYVPPGGWGPSAKP